MVRLKLISKVTIIGEYGFDALLRHQYSAVYSNTRQHGKMVREVSPRVGSNISSEMSLRWDRILAWVRTTLFGLSVIPEVYKRVTMYVLSARCLT